MTAKQFISMGLAYAGISQAELARRLGWTPQLYASRVKVGKFTLEEWDEISNALGADLEIHFKFPDGKQV